MGNSKREHEHTDALLERVFHHRLTRLELVKRGGVTALALGPLGALAGCGGGSSESGSDEVPSGTLNFFSWQGYDFLPDADNPAMAAWKKENGITVSSTYIATNEDVPAKVKGGGAAGLDMTTYGQGFSDLWHSLGIMSELDEDRIPNLTKLFPFFAGDEGEYWIKDGKRIGVPMFWGTCGLTYDSNAFPSTPTSYDPLFDKRYKGKVLVIEDVWGVYVQVARMLGLEISNVPKDKWGDVQGLIKELLAQTKGVTPTYGDAATKFASEGAVMAIPGWFPLNSFSADAGNDAVRSVALPEGGFTFTDAYAILPEAEDVELAHAFINQGLDARVNAEAANYLVGGTVCEPAVEFLDEGTKALYDYENFDQILEAAPLFGIPPQESDTVVTYQEVLDGWQEAKATVS